MGNQESKATAAQTESNTPEATEAEAPKIRRMVDVLRKARGGYAATVAYNGKPSLHNGDDLATALAGISPRNAVRVAQAIADAADPTNAPDIWAKYEMLNKGQQRMNSGNRIRAALKRGDTTLDAIATAIAEANTVEA
jgi:hypothetical protein